MRFMMLVRADKNTEAGVLPSKELVAAMGRFNEEMVKSGVLLAGEGIQPSSKGARVKFSRGAPTVTDGPFAETREQLGGYMLIDVKDLDEAIAIAARIPLARTSTVEVRPVREGQPS